MMTEGVPQARHYETREEWHKRTWEGKVQELRGAFTMEDVEVERLQNEWERELKDEASDLSEEGWSSSDDDGDLNEA